MDRVKLLGFGIDNFTFDEVINYAKQTSGQVITINPEMIEYALNNKDFANIIHDAQIVIPDGIGVQLGLKIKGYNIKRIAGVEFAKEMIKELKNEPVALVGAKPHIIDKAVKKLNEEFGGVNFVYVQDGYFKDEQKVLDEVKSKNPRLLLVALGSPKQEEFISKLKQDLPNALMVGVGGSFDVWSGEVERAPEIYQKMGLEWLYRTVKDPKRFKRIFPTLPLFMLKVLKEKWS